MEVVFLNSSVAGWVPQKTVSEMESYVHHISRNSCRKQKNSPPNVYLLIPGTCEYVTLHGTRDFADVNKLRILRWGDDPGLSG